MNLGGVPYFIAGREVNVNKCHLQEGKESFASVN